MTHEAPSLVIAFYDPGGEGVKIPLRRGVKYQPRSYAVSVTCGTVDPLTQSRVITPLQLSFYRSERVRSAEVLICSPWCPTSMQVL